MASSGPRGNHIQTPSSQQSNRTLSSQQSNRTPTTPQPRREQAIREARVVPSVEQSTQKDSFNLYTFLGSPSISSTSRTRRHQSESAVKYKSRHMKKNGDNDPWTPPSRCSGELSFGETPTAPNGYTPVHQHSSGSSSRHRSLTRPMTPFSPDSNRPDDHPSPGRTKEEPTDLSPLSRQDRRVIVQTSPSPSTYDTERRRRRLEKDGFVEQHVADFALHRLTKAREAALMEAISEQERRKLKGKAQEHRSDQSTYDSSEGSRKENPRRTSKSPTSGRRRRRRNLSTSLAPVIKLPVTKR